MEVDARRVDGTLVLDVRDRGPGHPRGRAASGSSISSTAPARGDRGERGTGLGLTIVRGMIGAHGGRVEALARDDGPGTVLRVSLPLAEPPPAEIPDDEA